MKQIIPETDKVDIIFLSNKLLKSKKQDFKMKNYQLKKKSNINLWKEKKENRNS